MSALYIVSTPIGNLSDMSLRAIEILKSVDIIAAEDTRHSKRLLSHFDIHTPCFSLHEYNEDHRIQKILTHLSNHQSVALISDAGTPLISDPGFRVVRAVQAAQYKVVPVPGACAAIAALVASGLPTDRFVFLGFLPAKATLMQTELEKLSTETRTMVFYESVHRIVKTLQMMKKILGDDRIATLAREITKTFETMKQDTLANLCDWIAHDTEQQRGEFVLVVQGAPAHQNTDSNLATLHTLLKILLSEVSVKQAVSLACKITGEKHKTAYDAALQLKRNIDNAS